MLGRICLTFVSIVTICVFGLTIAAQTDRGSKASGSVRGETFSYKYTDRDFAETPSWTAEDGDPPLSVARAIQTARINLPRFVESSENWKIRRIHLQSLNNDKWFYNIAFTCSSEPVCRELPTRQFTILVKMDGSILEPKKIVMVD